VDIRDKALGNLRPDGRHCHIRVDSDSSVLDLDDEKSDNVEMISEIEVPNADEQ
jgi:hypothetical protein